MAKHKGQLIQDPAKRSKIAIRKKKWTQLRRAHTNKQRKVNIGTWRLKQTTSYIQFLRNNTQKLKMMVSGEKSKVYKSMAAFIKTRTSLQCRSHHQKMMKTHQTVNQIIDHYSNVVIPHFQRELQRLQNQKAAERLRKQSSFYKISINQTTIRIEIDSRQIQSYL